MRAMLILFTAIAFCGWASKINSPGQLVDVEVLIFGCGYCWMPNQLVEDAWRSAACSGWQVLVGSSLFC